MRSVPGGRQDKLCLVSIRQHMLVHVSIRRRTSAYVRILEYLQGALECRQHLVSHSFTSSFYYKYVQGLIH